MRKNKPFLIEKHDVYETVANGPSNAIEGYLLTFALHMIALASDDDFNVKITNDLYYWAFEDVFEDALNHWHTHQSGEWTINELNVREQLQQTACVWAETISKNTDIDWDQIQRMWFVIGMEMEVGLDLSHLLNRNLSDAFPEA